MRAQVKIRLFLSNLAVLGSMAALQPSIANEFEVKRSERKYDTVASYNCLIKSPSYNGKCTHFSFSRGDYSANYHFYNNERRIVSFIVDLKDLRQIAPDNSKATSDFFAVWLEDGSYDRVKGVCTERPDLVECRTKRMSYMATQWEEQ